MHERKQSSVCAPACALCSKTGSVRKPTTYNQLAQVVALIGMMMLLVKQQQQQQKKGYKQECYAHHLWLHSRAASAVIGGPKQKLA